MEQRQRAGLAALAALCIAGSGFAETMLFDFETDADAEALKACKHYGLALSATNGLAASGARSMLVTSPKYRKGADQWPGIYLAPPVRDWTPYDRIVVTLLNPDAWFFPLGMAIADEGHTIHQSALWYTFSVPSADARQFVIPLSFPGEVKRTEISKVHFFLSEPPHDVAFCIDSIALLKPGEAIPQRTAALPWLAARAADAVAAIRAEAAALAAEPAAAALIGKASARLADDIGAAERDAARAKSLAEMSAARERIGAMRSRIAWLRSFIAFAEACRAEGIATDAPYLLGIAPPTQRVSPKTAFRLAPAKAAAVDLARGEAESVQVVVAAAGAVKGLSCAASDLAGPGGAVFPASAIDCDVMGYVHTDGTAPYDVPEKMEWWPNPILNFMKRIDIAPETAQSLWIRFRAPKGQAPGVYAGKLVIKAEGCADRELAVSARVRSFTLPAASPLPLAITFSPEVNPIAADRDKLKAWAANADFPGNCWRREREAWADFLADYFITRDSLYHRGEIDWDLLMRLKKQGRLGNFNLRYWHYFDDNDAERAAWKKETLAAIERNYARAKELGILDHAYIYGCDEISSKHFGRIKEATALIRAACPGVPLLTTAYDESYGLDSPLGALDGFCPLTPKYDAARAEAARAAGKQVWWYICCGPKAPYANAFIENDPIEMRILMGAQTAKERPDGFLYYQISIWNSEKPIESGPFTDWNARSWTEYHGDGAWTCVGPGGKPLPTQRLENFRDGLEDYAYVRELERRLASAPPEAYVWQAAAKGALAVPTNVVESMTQYTHDAAPLLAWRARLAGLIESAPAGEQ